jgi:hypothetical protein
MNAINTIPVTVLTGYLGKNVIGHDFRKCVANEEGRLG